VVATSASTIAAIHVDGDLRASADAERCYAHIIGVAAGMMTRLRATSLNCSADRSRTAIEEDCVSLTRSASERTRARSPMSPAQGADRRPESCSRSSRIVEDPVPILGSDLEAMPRAGAARLKPKTRPGRSGVPRWCVRNKSRERTGARQAVQRLFRTKVRKAGDSRSVIQSEDPGVRGPWCLYLPEDVIAGDRPPGKPPGPVTGRYAAARSAA